MSRFTRLLSGRKAQHKAQGRQRIRPQLEALEERALLANIQWMGEGVDDRWFTQNNWINRDTQAAQQPVNGDNLFFPSNAAQPENFNNFPALHVNSITFDGAGYTLNGNQFQLGAGGMTQSGSGTNRISNNIVLPATRTFNIAAGGNLALRALSGAGGVTKTGTGTLTFSLTTANTYTGTTAVNAGTLVLQKNAGVVAVPGTLVVGDNGLGDPGDVVVRLEANNQIADAASVTVNRTGQLNLDGHDETITGLTLSGGNVATGSGELTVLGNVTTNASLASATISGSLSLLIGGTRLFTVADGAANDDLIVSAQVRSGSLVLNKAGPGRMVLSGNNTALQATVVVSAGRLNIRSATALGSVVFGTTVANGATLEVQLASPIQVPIVIAEPLTLNGLGVFVQGFGNLGALHHVNPITVPPAPISRVTWTGTITLNSTTGIGSLLPFGGFNEFVVSGVISGAAGAGLTKLGFGLVRLTAANTYPGPTTLPALVPNTAPPGTLLIDGSQPSSSVTVNLGGTLGGVGTIGALTANSGGTVSPGTLADATGTLTVQGNVTLNSGSTLFVNLTTPAASDQLRLIGPGNRTVALNNPTLAGSASTIRGDQVMIINNTTSGGTTGAFSNGTFATISTRPFRINTGGGNFNDVVVTHENTAPMVQFIQLNPAVIVAGAFTSLVGQLTDPDAGDFHTLYIAWGDGSPLQIEHPALAQFAYPHQYVSPGQYRVVAFWADQTKEGNYRVLPLTVLPSGAPGGTGKDTAPLDDLHSLLPASRAGTAPHANQAAALSAVLRETTAFLGTVTAGSAGADGQDGFLADPGRDRVSEANDKAFLEVLVADFAVDLG